MYPQRYWSYKFYSPAQRRAAYFNPKKRYIRWNVDRRGRGLYRPITSKIQKNLYRINANHAAAIARRKYPHNR